MTIDRIFFAFMVVCGLAAGAVLVFAPQTRDGPIPPYFWVLIPMALFEGINFARTRGAPGTVISVWARLAGFAVAIAIMVAMTALAGQTLQLL